MMILRSADACRLGACLGWELGSVIVPLGMPRERVQSLLGWNHKPGKGRICTRQS